MSEQKKVIAITGATGFLGAALSEHLSENGFIIRALVRNPDFIAKPQIFEAGVFNCKLPREVDALALKGVDVLIHCAYSTDGKKSELENIQGAQDLVNLANVSNVPKLIFISSIAAHSGARSIYGRSKFIIENKIWPKDQVIIRPGTIIGHGGLFGRITSLAKSLPILPIFFARSRSLQVVSLRDLIESIRIVLDKNLSGQFNIAAPDSVPIHEFYSAIIRASSLRTRCIPLPHLPFLWVTQLIELLGLKAPITSDNILGLKYLKNFPVQESLNRVGLKPKTFLESLKLVFGK